MAALFLFALAGFGALALLYVADRALKARAQARRLRRMNKRLDAATARAEEQQARRQAVITASKELTSVIPAIKRPPATLPGLKSHSPARPGHGGGRRAPASGGTGAGRAGRLTTGPLPRRSVTRDASDARG